MNQIFFKNKQRSKLPSLYYFYYIRKRKTFFKIDSAKKCTYIIIRLMIWKGGGDTAHAQAELDLDAGCKVQAAGDCLLVFFDEPTPITYFFLINRTKSRFYTNTMGANSVEACMVSLTVSTSASRFCDSALCGVYLWVLSKTSNLTEDLKLFVGVWVLVFLCDSRIHPISQLQLALLSATVHIFQLTFAHDANKKSTHAFLFLFFFLSASINFWHPLPSFRFWSACSSEASRSLAPAAAAWTRPSSASTFCGGNWGGRLSEEDQIPTG